jgi:hypothetical protein
MPLPIDHSAHHSRQFSLRELFLVTLVVAIVMTAGVLCRESRNLRGLYSVWTLVSLLIVASVWVVYRLRLVRPRILGYGSLGLYSLSMCLPVMPMPFQQNERMFGWQIAWGTFTETPKLFGELVSEKEDHRWTAGAYMAGSVANVVYVIGYGAALVSLKWTRVVFVARWSGAIAFVAAIAARLMIQVGLFAEWTSAPVFYPAFGLWAASFLALALGIRKNAADKQYLV